jgi:hypothetical protein
MAAPNPRVRNVAFLKTKIMQPALTSHYEIYIQPPESARSFINQSIFPYDIADILTISCSEASLPGSNLMTHELNNDYTGVTQKHAYRRIYDNTSDFTFYVNQGYDQIRYFESWVRYISGEQVSNAENLNNFYRIRYPKRYKSPSISIVKFERNTGTGRRANKMEYKFINAFPLSISSMPVSYESSQLLKVSVSFSYDRYIAGNTAPNQSRGEPSAPATAAGVPNPYTQAFSPQTQAALNAANFRNLNLGSYSAGTLTNTSFGEGEEIINAVTSNQRFVEAGLPYVGRNVGPIARFSGL